MGFPTLRPRRLRVTPTLRALVRETALEPSDFVYPLFFHAALKEPRAISTMPGIFQLPVSHAAAQAKDLAALPQARALTASDSARASRARSTASSGLESTGACRTPAASVATTRAIEA